MTGSEFLAKARRYAKARGLQHEYLPNRGKGSHGVLIVGDRRTVVQDPRKEIPPGTLSAMLRQLGIKKGDFG
jgi:mRNA interferase HicA